jgi:hypothetical protein
LLVVAGAIMVLWRLVLQMRHQFNGGNPCRGRADSRDEKRTRKGVRNLFR